LQPTDAANLATAIVLVSTSMIPIILSILMKEPKDTSLKHAVHVTRFSTLLLGLFLFVHGFYHVAEYLGNDFYSDDIFGPTSILILLGFTLYVWKYIFVQRSKSKRIDTPTVIAPVKNRLLMPMVALPIFLSISSAIIGNVPEILSLVGIVASCALFLWMVIKNPAFNSLHFQFAVIVLVWAAAEIPHGLDTLGVITLGGVDVWGTWVHFASMLLIGLFICARTIRIALFTPYLTMKKV
jgi:hypothetical protein